MNQRYFVWSLVGVAVLVLFITALAFSLGNGSTAPVLLPTEAPDSTPDASVSGAEQELQNVLTITPENVQAAIASLERSTDYFTQIMTSLHAPNGDRDVLVSIWVQGTSTHALITYSNYIKNILTDGKEYWIWYSDDVNTAFHGKSALEGAGLAENLSGLPDYNEILELEPESIKEAAYAEYKGSPCIMVVAETDGGENEYIIDTKLGLLIGYTRRENGEEIFTLSADVNSPGDPSSDVFKLPDSLR